MIGVRDRSVISTIILGSLCAGVSAQVEEDSYRDQIRVKYAPIDRLALFAEAESGSRRIEIAVDAGGRFSYLQFDNEIFEGIYSGHRDTESEWKIYPAHFNYYDGERTLFSSDPGDPAGMFIEQSLEKPLGPGEAVQVKGCIWPLLPSLIDQGTFSVTDNAAVLEVVRLDLAVHFNTSHQVTKVTWGAIRGEGTPVAAWVYSGYKDSPHPLLPTKMVRAFSFEKKSISEVEMQHQHYRLIFSQDPQVIQRLLNFTDDSGEYRRKVASTDNVYDADGTLLYNEKEMADEYLAAINDSGPSQWRLVLLIGVAVAAFASAWLLKAKKGAS